MVQRLTCPQGHEWEHSPDSTRAEGADTLLCPKCGASPIDLSATVSVTSPPQSDSAQTTIGMRANVPDFSTDWPSIPGYEIISELGRGGMGVVYKARQVALNRLVALKMIRTGSQAGAEELERFRREAEAVARLQHPNIVQIYEIGNHKGQPYFSLELVNGASLAERLNGMPLPPREAAWLTETVAHAIAAAHARGIVHRDLKPANVLLGVPRCLARTSSATPRRRAGSVMKLL